MQQAGWPEGLLAMGARPRRLVYDVVHHAWFDTFFMLVILAYALVLAVYDPLKADDVMPLISTLVYPNCIKRHRRWVCIIMSDMCLHFAPM
jgi:hypothetical protein